MGEKIHQEIDQDVFDVKSLDGDGDGWTYVFLIFYLHDPHIMYDLPTLADTHKPPQSFCNAGENLRSCSHVILGPLDTNSCLKLKASTPPIGISSIFIFLLECLLLNFSSLSFSLDFFFCLNALDSPFKRLWSFSKELLHKHYHYHQ